MEKNIVIEAKNIEKSYFTKKGIYTNVLSGLNLTIYKSEMTAIMGPSGVGKSTLLHLLGSLDYPESGSIKLNDQGKEIEYLKISSDKLSMLRNKRIGFVFQFSHLLPEFSSLENVMIPGLIAGKPKTEVKDEALRLLKLVEVEHRAKHKPMELSGGEQQRVAIARAIINKPAVVFADEPTGNLDSNTAKSILKLIAHLKEKSYITFVIATHSREVSEMADRIIILGNGKVVDDKRKN